MMADRYDRSMSSRAARRLVSLIAVSSAALMSNLANAVEAHSAWPGWDRFKKIYLSADGRVIDASLPQQITTSEGQSYALFFALVANDRAAFATALRWTQDNLAAGDLARSLPAWRWGRSTDGSWRVLDPNPASDADLWIAYALNEAGRLWCDPLYAALGRSVAARILREEVALIPGLGATLLPGPRGFIEKQTWRLNASYVPIQLLRGIGRHSGEKLWSELLKSSQRLIIGSSPRGFAADWIQYRAPEGFITDSETRGIGSYNAIRVYLWAGMLPPNDPLHARLARQLAPMLNSTAQRAAPVEEVDTHTLAMKGDGSPGFSAAMLPMLQNARKHIALATHRSRAATNAFKDDQAYYSDVLTLFGLGWIEGRYRFTPSGLLELQWPGSCRDAR